MMLASDNTRPFPDQVMADIADFAATYFPKSEAAWNTARLCLIDALGCALAALNFDACTRLLGPVIPGWLAPGGARPPGTHYQLDPFTASFNLGAMIRWLDFNDTWLAAEWGHPSDNLGGILMTADWLARRIDQDPNRRLIMRDVLKAMIIAYEIQGILALENSFNRAGLDHVVLVKVASTAVSAVLIGCSREQVFNAISNAWVDGHALRTYRHAPNTGTRKSWAAGDATARGVWLAWLASKGEMGYPTALSTPTWGFYDALFRSQPFTVNQAYGSYVIENILFKVSFPAEFHAQTAVEAALQLSPLVRDRLDEVDRVVITTQEAAMRIINKVGPLNNPADRDHCIQYMTACALIFGELTAQSYEADFSADPRIDELRKKMFCVENPSYTRDYLEPSKRSIANAVQVFFKDGTATDTVEVEYPTGHRTRRAEANPLLFEKFHRNCSGRMKKERVVQVIQLMNSPAQLDAMPVDQFVDLFIPEEAGSP
jgi:2-methylcitrate dehydratase